MKHITRKLKAVTLAVMISFGFAASAQTTTFDINVHDITETDASVKVTPSNSSTTYCMGYKSKEAFDADGGIDKVVENQIQQWKDDVYGDQTWQDVAYWSIYNGTIDIENIASRQYELLTAGTNYVVYVFGIERGSGNVTTPVTIKEFRTLGGEPVVQNSLTLAVSDITASDAYLTCTPSSNDFKYCMFVKSKADFEAAGGEANAVNSHIAAWERMGDMYNEPWYDSMALYQHSGTYGVEASESIDMYPETDYVAYAFAIDKDKNVVAPLVIKEFTTLGGEKSDNTFTLSVTEIVPTSSIRATVKAHCVPTNNDTYTVKCILKSTVDKYDLTTEAGEKSFIEDEVMYPLYNSMIYSGTKDVEFTNMTLNNEYCLVAVGVSADKTPTTGATLLPFTCTDKPDVPQESISIAISDITASDAYMTFTPSNNTLKYCFFVESKAAFDAAGGAEAVINNRIAYWERMAESYSNKTWIDMMALFQHTGVYGETASESIGALMPETEYVAYAFAIDNDKNVLAPVVTKEFTTLAGEKSDNTFTLSIVSIEPTSDTRANVKARCVPSNDDTYNVKCILKSTVDKYDLTTADGEKKFIEDEMMYPLYNNMIYTGTKDLEFDNMALNSEYCLVAMGVTYDKVATTGLTVLPFMCGESKPEISGTIALDVTDVTGMDARIKITPSSDDFIYFYDVTTPELIEEKGGVQAIPEKFIIDWWKFLADFYDDLTWQDVMKMQCSTGSIDEMAQYLIDQGLLSRIYWDQALVLYAVGFDQSGNVVTPTATFDFHTLEPTPSDLTIDFGFAGAEITNESGSLFNATIDVIPSDDNEEYLVNYCADRIFDQYDENSPEDMFEYLSYQFYPYAQKCQGPSQHRFENLYVNQAGTAILQDYYLIAVGWNEGPTTPIYKFLFNAETSSIEKVVVDDVQVMGGQGELYILGEFDNARVYNTAGQCVATVNRPGSVRLSGGMYIVQYTANGVSGSAKVIVK